MAWLQTSGFGASDGTGGNWRLVGDGRWELGGSGELCGHPTVAPTTSVAPAAADQVSALTAARFSAHAQLYQMVSAQAVAIHDRFVAALAAGAQSYEAAEAANVIAAG